MNTRRQAVSVMLGQLQRLLLSVERLKGQHRAKDFFTDRGVAAIKAGQQRWLVISATQTFEQAAAGKHLCACLPRALNNAVNTGGLQSRDNRWQRAFR